MTNQILDKIENILCQDRKMSGLYRDPLKPLVIDAALLKQARQANQNVSSLGFAACDGFRVVTEPSIKSLSRGVAKNR